MSSEKSNYWKGVASRLASLGKVVLDIATPVAVNIGVDVLIGKACEKIESRLKQQDDRISAEFKIIYEKFDTQTKEIAQELRTMADFIYERDKKLIKGLEKKIDQEIEYNKAAHEVYDARFRKLELGQASLEARVTELERVRKVS